MGLLQQRLAIKALYIAVLGLQLISAGADLVGQCPNINTGQVIFLQDSADCSIFHFCNWGAAIEFACPNGLRFNLHRKSCDLMENVNCFEATKFSGCDGCSKAECPIVNAENVTFFPHNTDCGKYCMCDWGVAYERPCPQGLHWNTKLDVCDWPMNAECSLVDDDSSGDCNIPTSDPPTENTSTEFSSTNNVPTSSTDGTLTDPTPTTIDPPIASSGCNGASCPQSNDVNVTFFQHDENCDQYCVCNWGVAVEMSCPPDLYFNTELNVCDYPENVDCDRYESDTTTESSVEITTAEQAEVPTTSSSNLPTTDITTENISDSDGCLDINCLVSTPMSLYPHKTDCNKYCVCNFGLTMEMPCPNGFHFNRASNICDYPKDARCGEDVSFETTETPNEPPSSLDDCSYIDCSLSDYNVFYSHPTDCEKYCICSSGITIEMTCPGSFHYNRILEMCDYPVNAECPIESPTSTPENYNGCSYAACSISNGTVYFPHQTDCNQYCICVVGIIIEQTCPDGYLFNRELNICDSSATNAKCISDNAADTTISPITPPTHSSGCSQVSCPTRNAAVFFSHENDCGKYCVCNLGVTVEMPCPNGLHFNVDLDVCDYPENALCDEGSLGETPSSTSTESTPSSKGCSATVCTQHNSPAFFEHEQDCGKYCVCNSGVTIAMACPKGLHFNKQLNTCESSNDASCKAEGESDTTTYPTVDFDGCSNAICANVDDDNVTFFPHDLVCDKYCVCNWGHAIEMPCPDGLYFNAELNVCDFPQNSGCINDEVGTTEWPDATEDVTTQDVTKEDVTTEDITTEDVTTEDVTTEGVTTEDVTTEDVTTEDATTEDVTTEDATTEDVTTEDATTEDVTTEDVTTEDVTIEDATTEDVTTEEIEDSSTENELEATTVEDETQNTTTEEIGNATTEEGDIEEGITTEGGQEITSTTIEDNGNLSTTEPAVPLTGCNNALCPAVNDIYVTFLKHQLDCGKYCVCDWGRAIEMLCPPGLHFNINLNVCDYPINAKCIL